MDTHTPQTEQAFQPHAWEQKWKQWWHNTGIYQFQRDPNKPLFAIDTPPPTVSGIIHIGHVYGYVQQDFAARFRRMQGYNVFYPFGFDDNGIGSEMFVEKQTGKHAADMSREEFRQICLKETEMMEEKMKQLWVDLGISPDWSYLYRTISPEVMKTSQLSFIQLYHDGLEYRKKGPNFFCPYCSTAVSQAELETDRQSTYFNDIQFTLQDGNTITIGTTRPELLPACVAIFVHPDDTDNQHLVGKTATVPIFGQEVPILADERVGMETGSGIVMCCTFGDQTDIDWYYAHELPLRMAIDENGNMTDVAEDYAGMKVKEARQKIISDLEKNGYLENKKEIEHDVKVHERCDADIEFLITEQWFINILDMQEKWRELGEQLTWYPPHMKTRYDNWVDGLQWDWCISRQRYYGIPFPVWYCASCGEVILANEEQLPVDPLKDTPQHSCKTCGSSEVEPEQDVMDTWATSALTPLINAEWGGQTMTDRYPMTLRPQAHEIISFWLFHTIVKCYYHTKQVPFQDVYINGHVLDPYGKKMSKSKGNVVDPIEVMNAHPSDAIRFWAAGYKMGEDIPYMPSDVETAERFMRKIWNAYQFAGPFLKKSAAEQPPEELQLIDRWMLAQVDQAVAEVTKQYGQYAFHQVNRVLRRVFWHQLCDNYLEMIKPRLYNNGLEPDTAAAYTLYTALLKLTKLLAPIMPFITEEVYQQHVQHIVGAESIHLTEWPTVDGWTEPSIQQDGQVIVEATTLLRKYKSEHAMSLNVPVTVAKLHPHQPLHNKQAVLETIQDVMHIQQIDISDEILEEQITEAKLMYATVGPRYGQQVKQIEQKLANNNFQTDADEQHICVTVDGDHISLTIGEEVSITKTVTVDGYTVLQGDSVAVLVQNT